MRKIGRKLAVITIYVALIGFIPAMKANALDHAQIRAEMLRILYGGSGGRMTCDFDGYTTTKGRHEGIDMALRAGTPVYSLIDGEVTYVKNSNSSGTLSTCAIYDFSNNKTVIYLHSANISVRSGSRVSRGQQIATESNRGASAAHTHVEVRNGRQTRASKSLNDPVLDNPNPYPYWETVLGGGGQPVGNVSGDYPYPIKAYTISKDRVTTYKSPNGAVSGYISGNEDLCIIQEVYTDGWAKVTYPTSKGNKTAYCPMGEFISSGVGHYTVSAQQNVNVFRRADMAQSLGTIYPSDTVIVAGRNGDKLQVIYPVSGGYKLGWAQEQALSVVRPEDIGTDFYALIRNASAGKLLTNASDNVVSCSERQNASQIWKFDRNGDGSYRITSMADGKCLDTNGASSQSETNVQVYAANDSGAQRWNIGRRQDGSYNLSPRCASGCAMDVTGASGAENTNIQIYTYNNTGAQIFDIQKINLIEGLDAKDKEINLKAGETYKAQENIRITPGDAYQPNLTYTSDKPDIASVSDDGTVQALYEGTATIHAAARDGSKRTVDIKVKVAEEQKEPTPSVPEEPDKEEPPAPGSATISAEELSIAPGETLTIPVRIQNNPGLMGFSLQVKYDPNVLHSPAVKPGTITSKGSMDNSIGAQTDGEFKILWNHTEEIAEEGILFYLEFQTDSSITAGSCDISIHFNPEDTFNEAYQTISIEDVVFPLKVQDMMAGDVNQDKVVNNKDVVMLLRYLVGKEILAEDQMRAADVIQDSKLNNKDAVKISRYLVGKESLS